MTPETDWQNSAYKSSPAWCRGCDGKRLAVSNGYCDACLDCATAFGDDLWARPDSGPARCRGCDEVELVSNWYCDTCLGIEAATERRESALRALGFDLPTDEQRREQLDRNLAIIELEKP